MVLQFVIVLGSTAKCALQWNGTIGNETSMRLEVYMEDSRGGERMHLLVVSDISDDTIGEGKMNAQEP
jgi:hypothetical protein